MQVLRSTVIDVGFELRNILSFEIDRAAEQVE